MEGPLLVLKSWALTALCIWVYKRWFQRVAPPAPEFETFCRKRPIVAALLGAGEHEPRLRAALGPSMRCVATLGGYPWPHYVLELGIESCGGALLFRIEAARVRRSGDLGLPALASVLRDSLNDLPEDVEAWLHAGTFNNGLVEVPAGGWAVERGAEKHPRLTPLERAPGLVEHHLAFENHSPRCLPLGTAYTTPWTG